MDYFSDISNSNISNYNTDQNEFNDNPSSYWSIFIIFIMVIGIMILYILEKEWYYLIGIIVLIIYCLSLLGKSVTDKLYE